MDPLTHTLLGANLASTRLRETTRLATAALVVGANLPDVDSILYFTGHDDLALGFRRGWTHGVLALVVLPFLLTGLLLLYDRLRPDPQRRASPRWLFALSALAILTHPFLDWLNNYGMRWLMPFDGTWSYGDSVYIMDPSLWLILGVGVLALRRPSMATVVMLIAATALLMRVVARRSPDYLIVVAIVAVLLLLALLWRPRSRRIPDLTLIAASTYIVARLIVNEATEARVAKDIAQATGQRVERVMASPHPIDPTRWDIVAQTGDVYRYGRYTWRNGLALAPDRLPVARPSPEWEAARRHPSVRGFMTWVRFPWYEVERDAHETRVLIHDARYVVRRRAGGGFGGVVVRLPRNQSAVGIHSLSSTTRPCGATAASAVGFSRASTAEAAVAPQAACANPANPVPRAHAAITPGFELDFARPCSDAYLFGRQRRRPVDRLSQIPNRREPEMVVGQRDAHDDPTDSLPERSILASVEPATSG